MKSSIIQREKYYTRAIELRLSGLSYRKISKIIPVAEKTIRRWFIIFTSENNINPIVMKVKKVQPATSKAKADVSSNVKDLEKRIKDLELQIKKANIRADFYEEMINVAETRLNISIRKKAGAKQ